jgi:hypothetical protein
MNYVEMILYSFNEDHSLVIKEDISFKNNVMEEFEKVKLCFREPFICYLIIDGKYNILLYK